MKKRMAYRGCPLKVTLECFSFAPLDTTVESLKLTPEQIEMYGLKPGQRLQWCSECENVFHVSSNNFAYIIGKRNIPGGPFIPGDAKNSRYIG